MYDEESSEWHLFDATQAQADGPFAISYRNTDPRNSARCNDPLTHIADVDYSNQPQLFDAINAIRAQNVEGWNCQNYVKEVLQSLVDSLLITQSVVDEALGELSIFDGYMEANLAEIQQAAQEERRGMVLSEAIAVDSEDSDDA